MDITKGQRASNLHDLTPMLRLLPALVLAQAACAEPWGVPTNSPAAQEQTPPPAADPAADAGARSGSETQPASEPERLYLALDASLPATVVDRLVWLVEQASPRPVVRAGAPPTAASASRQWLISIGNTWARDELITAADLAALGSEGFIVRAGSVAGMTALVTDGNPLDPDPFGHTPIGRLMGAYALLQALGYGFLHPLEPTIPDAFDLAGAQVDMAEAPRWSLRGLQLHTMHPIELTNVLNGWGEAGPNDRAGFERMLPEWQRAVEWLVANRQNRVHWVLLDADAWDDAFGESQERQDRLASLAAIGHAWGLAVGVDTPIALGQQHAFRLLRQRGELDDELAEISGRIDWLMQAGFDYLATEAGTTEFTNPGAERMLAWMNRLAAHLDEAHDGKRAYIKIHCSQGQTVDGYVGEDGEPLNFNFLPALADARLGVMPHTVQIYALDDPAPTYGNEDFDFMRRFLRSQLGVRPVVWHPETAYWVSYDIDVPLFLPVYARQRVHDLHLLADDETSRGVPLEGQIIFSSGWEWGYWLNDVVAARAAWLPRRELSADEALRETLREVLKPLGEASTHVADVVTTIARDELALLVRGEVSSQHPANVVRRNGQAYLQGFEPWDDVMDIGRMIPALAHITTQPDKLGLVEMTNPWHEPPTYPGELEPLLDAMASTFTRRADELEGAAVAAPASARAVAQELVDSARITALRATQVAALYRYVARRWAFDTHGAEAALDVAREALDQAWELVAQREAAYRVPPERIAGWSAGPTVYPFRYLWTVRSLYFWWRDELKAVQTPRSPCVLNVINPAVVGLGEGWVAEVTRIVRKLTESVPLLGSLTECLAEPETEPVFPPEGLR